MKTYNKFILEKSEHESTKILDVPIFKQQKGWSCGDASLKMILKYYGITVSEEDLIIDLDTDKVDGTIPKNIVKYCHKIGLKTDARNDMTVKDLRSYIDNDIPVIIEFQSFKNDPKITYEEDLDDGHFSVVVGYTKNSIIYNDPWVKKQKRISDDRLLKCWHDINRGIVDNKYGIAIYP